MPHAHHDILLSIVRKKIPLSRHGLAVLALLAPVLLAQPTNRPADLLPLRSVYFVRNDPDWMAITSDGVWVAVNHANKVVRLDAGTNRIGVSAAVKDPCSGLAADFGSLWVPSCGEHALVRMDATTGERQAVIPAAPADSEGGIATGAGSVWLVTSESGELTRVDAATNTIRARIPIPAGSFNPLFAYGAVWVTSHKGGTLLRIDPATSKVTDQIPVGPEPRFLAAGAGSLWVLNQGNGTVARVNASTRRLVATIPAHIPGHGGDIAFGADAVWATLIGTPLTRIDPATNRVTSQWHGEGGDEVRFGFGSLWLTHIKAGFVWRLNVPHP